MEKENKEFIIQVRVSYAEKSLIKERANKTEKNISEFIRNSALGCKIKEKPDKELFKELIKEMRDIERAIRNLGREAHVLGFINEPMLERERIKWSNFIVETKQKFL